MQRNVEVAEEQGLLRIRDGVMVSLGDARALHDDEICYLVTGSQGEMRAALWNLATSTYKGMEIEKGDTVVLSARIIPGNEKAISRLIGHLYKRGANIIEEKRRLVHVSGHAAQEDIRIMVETARPRYLVPIHGEYRMLFRHKEFVKNHVDGYTDDNIILIENGEVLEVVEFAAKIVDKHELHRTFIDEESMGEIEYSVVRERKHLAYGGAVSLVVTVDKQTHQLTGEPQITFQGVAGLDLGNGFIGDAREAIKTAVADMRREHIVDRSFLKENLRIVLKRFIQKQIGTKPVIVTTIVEV
jgi:ribonuclease J